MSGVQNSYCTYDGVALRTFPISTTGRLIGKDSARFTDDYTTPVHICTKRFKEIKEELGNKINFYFVANESRNKSFNIRTVTDVNSSEHAKILSSSAILTSHFN